MAMPQPKRRERQAFLAIVWYKQNYELTMNRGLETLETTSELENRLERSFIDLMNRMVGD